MISIIIPLYNKEKSILTTLSSIFNQTFDHFELIIIDDGSTDNSYEIVSNLSDPRIRLFRQENKGVSNARNFGINQSIFSLIALIDADDLWEPTYLEEMLIFIQDFPNASLYGCGWSKIDRCGNKSSYSYGLITSYRGYVEQYFNIDKYNILFHTSAVIFRKLDFEEVGRFDEQLILGEDLDLWFRFALKKKVAYLNKQLTFYNIGSENRLTERAVSFDKTLLARLDKYKEYEFSNNDFKRFIDTWRLHNVVNMLRINIFPLSLVKKVLKEIDLSNFSAFWRFLVNLPSYSYRIFYKTWRVYIQIFYKKDN